MPGRSWVAGIAIAGYVSLSFCDYVGGRRGRPHFPPDTGFQLFILHGLELIWEQHPNCYRRISRKKPANPEGPARIRQTEPQDEN
jgi:hypothetical protein